MTKIDLSKFDLSPEKLQEIIEKNKEMIKRLCNVGDIKFGYPPAKEEEDKDE